MIDSGVVDATQAVAITWLQEGRRCVQAVLVAVEGSAPLPVGAMLLVGADGAIEGSITGGCVGSSVVEQAEAILAGRRRAGVLTYDQAQPIAPHGGIQRGISDRLGPLERRLTPP